MAEEARTSAMLRKIVSELRQFAVDGQDKWRRHGGGSRLPTIESLMQNGDGGEQPSDVAMCDAIEAACASLEPEWQDAARQHLGYGEDPLDALGDREHDAAKCLPGRGNGRMSLRTYQRTRENGEHKGRRYGGRTFDSWGEVTLTLVAEALVRSANADPNAPEGADMVALRANGEGGGRLGDAVRKRIAGLYKPIKPDDFEKSFFHRDSTDEYIEALASLSAVTLYAGAGVSADVQAPLSDELMHWSLVERLHAETAMNEKQRERVVNSLSRVYPPAYLGSIAREYVRQHSDDDPDELGARTIFVGDFRNALQAGRNTGSGFLAFGIGALAFALRKAGKNPVRVMTTNYDERIDEAEKKVHDHFEGLKGFSFESYTLSGREDPDDRSIPLYSLNGQLQHLSDSKPDPPIIGEADALTPYHWRRSELQDTALTETSCIFIGSSLAEPDVLSKLVNQQYDCSLPRYAIVLTPELDLEDADERAMARNLIAQRFLHLGVVPIIIDFPHQAPQLLIEVALRLEHGDAYRNYPGRLEHWWGSRAQGFGFGPENGSDGGKRSLDLQQAWMEELATVRDRVVTQHLELEPKPHEREEQIQLEVWLRHPDTRRLILWATSEGVWENANTAHRCDIYQGDEFAVQRAFRDGRPHLGTVSPPRGIWRYQVSIPLVLKSDSWHHLPVGVVSVLSNKGPTVKNDEGAVFEKGGRLGTFIERENLAKDLALLIKDVSGTVTELLSN